jgi:hypothetical protein
LKPRTDVLALGFHVTYWDQLGWPDRFATAATTERQRHWQRALRTAYVYTPQVIVNGEDRRPYPGPLDRPGATAVAATLSRNGDLVTARVQAAGAGGSPLAAYWAVLEDGHASRVRAGENAGATLLHDHVVVQYQAVPAWSPGVGSGSEMRLEWRAPTALSAPGALNRRAVLVVTDARTLKPVQAVVLSC